MTELTQEESERYAEINEAVDDVIMPVIFEMDDELEDEFTGCVIFAVFIECMHCLFYMGWTPENLKEEVESHHELHVESEAETTEVMH